MVMVRCAEGAGWKEGQYGVVDVGSVLVDDFIEPFHHSLSVDAELEMNRTWRYSLT